MRKLLQILCQLIYIYLKKIFKYTTCSFKDLVRCIGLFFDKGINNYLSITKIKLFALLAYDTIANADLSKILFFVIDLVTFVLTSDKFFFCNYCIIGTCLYI